MKENRRGLHEDARLYFGEFRQEMDAAATYDNGRGRIERREYRLLLDGIPVAQGMERLEGPASRRACPSRLAELGSERLKAQVEEKGAVREYTRYHITSLTDINELASAARKHWGIENNLHWHLDVMFREDASCARKDSSPLNLNVLREA